VNSCSEKKPEKSVLKNGQRSPAKIPQWIGRFYPFIFFAVCFLATWVWRATVAGSPLLDAIIISAAAIATLLVVSQRLPLQNVVGLVVTIAIFWWATLLIAKVSGVFLVPPRFNFRFFREYEFGLFWIVGLINARGISKLSLCRFHKSANYGLWLIVLASLLLTIEDLQARESLTYFTGKFLFVGIVLVTMTPWFIDKKRIEQKPDYQPLLVTLLLMLW
jgi:hypothetical protein